ncbi:hypothetical protein LTR10_020740 [Elasticomyces elasticus]|uniref:Ubiquitin-like protease family profile domain-containing protein n=1 Tax=Exophiala sideris TaxID=1016849 RepID=A0ABR0JP50_9EURO|nr:hypothetical protein LTR10_020740 [Elasticomyces elasticus]KAK5036667.1 hypothetical protein LTS07_002395 [Exophiala sideris]KAK5041504.1 hypothetical protein LTR13_002170 [Exophiala sideris]KAK5067051.1 hypothetical protein LTR69_002400 [Exophiala sideris]KAK5185109.1 hypothetical protein LTR44_002956 [Eurotiomycetes sp. CCFEE 6388]
MGKRKRGEDRDISHSRHRKYFPGLQSKYQNNQRPFQLSVALMAPRNQRDYTGRANDRVGQRDTNNTRPQSGSGQAVLAENEASDVARQFAERLSRRVASLNSTQNITRATSSSGRQQVSANLTATSQSNIQRLQYQQNPSRSAQPAQDVSDNARYLQEVAMHGSFSPRSNRTNVDATMNTISSQRQQSSANITSASQHGSRLIPNQQAQSQPLQRSRAQSIPLRPSPYQQTHGLSNFSTNQAHVSPLARVQDDTVTYGQFQSSAKRQHTARTPSNSTTSSTMLSPVPKRLRPVARSATPEQITVSAAKDAVRRSPACTTQHALTIIPPSMIRNPIEKPNNVQQFAWGLVAKWTADAMTEGRGSVPPVLTSNEADQIKHFGTIRMVQAYQDIVDALPRDVHQAHIQVALAARQRIEEIEKVANHGKGPWMSLEEGILQWKSLYKEAPVNIRGGNPSIGGTIIFARSLKTLLRNAGKNQSGWLNDEVVHGGVAAAMGDEFYPCIVIGSLDWQAVMQGTREQPLYWGETTKLARYIIVNEQKHWFLLLASPITKIIASLDSLVKRDERDPHVKKLMQIAKQHWGQVRFDGNIQSKKQGNKYDCGVWVVENFKAMRLGGPPALRNVEVNEAETRLNLLESLMRAAEREQRIEWPKWHRVTKPTTNSIPNSGVVEVDDTEMEKATSAGARVLLSKGI